jgi:hypothetical protein
VLSVQYKEQAFQRWTRPLEIQRIVVVQYNITHEGDAANVSTNSLTGGGKEQTGTRPGSLFFLAFPHHGNLLIAHMGEPSQPIDRDTAVLVMIAALGDGRQPAGCLELLNGCMQIFQDHRSWFVEALAKKHSALASLWMRFVCTHRSIRELGALSNFMTKCRCSKGPLIIRNAPPILHVADPCRHGHHSSHMGDIVDQMCLIISIVLEKKPRLNGLYRARMSGSRWPYQMQDLVPFDQTRSWHGLSVWFPFATTSNGSGTLMIALLEAYGSYWLKGLFVTPAVQFWLNYTVEAQEGKFVKYGSTSNTATSVLNVFETLADLLLRLSNVLFDDELLLWTSALTDVVDSTGDMMKICVKAVEIIHIADKTLSSWERHEKGSLNFGIEMQFAGFAARMAATAPRLLATFPPKDLPKSIKDAVIGALKSNANPFMQMMHSGFGSQWKDRCYGPGCLNTAQAHGHQFAMCSYCKLARYCSRKCQRTGWRFFARSSSRRVRSCTSDPVETRS